MNQNEILKDLILSILSVNGWSIEKLYKYKDSLEKHGLFELSNLSSWDAVKIGNKMKEAGYERGGITWIVSDRLSALGKFANSKGINEFNNILISKNREKISEFLLPIKGIGNKVLENFFILIDI